MVEQLDGLGLVYEKRGNTGAAAYEQSDRVDPFRVITNQLANDFQREQRNIEINQEKKDRANLDVLKGLGDIKGWEIDNQAFIYNEANQLKNEAQQLVTKGKNLSDLFDPEVRAFNEKTQKLAQQAPLSIQQGKVIDAMKMDVMKNPQKYDTEETRKALEAYSAMKPNERLNTPVESLFVPKFNRYALVPKASQIQNFVNISPKGGTTIDDARLDQFMQLQFATEEGQRAYEIGVQKGEWATPEEYIKANKDYLVSQIKNKSDRYYAPRPTTGPSDKDIDVSIRGTEEVMLGFEKTVESKGADGKTTFVNKKIGSVPIKGMTALGKIALTIPKDIVESQQGVKFDTNLELDSGNLAIAPYNLKTNTYAKVGSDGKITIDGNTYTIEEAIKEGLVKYKPILSGQVKYYGSQQDIVVDPEKYARKINSTSKTYEEYNKILGRQKAYAEELNNKYKGTETTSTTTTKPTTPAKTTTPTKTTTGTSGATKTPTPVKNTTVTGGKVR